MKSATSPASEPIHLTEAHYRSMFKTTRSAVVCLAPDHKIIEWNHGAEQIFGFTREEVLGQDYLELFLPEEYRQRVAERIRKVLSGEICQDCENPVRTRSGAERVLIWNASRLADESNEAIGLVMIGQDITALKQAQALQAGENRVLELLAKGGTLADVLATLANTIEGVCPGLRCVVMLADNSGQRLECAAAPSLPDDLRRGLDGLAISPSAIGCGGAAHFSECVIIEDIEGHSRRSAHLDLALQNGLRACCSQPIMSGAGEILGTFAAYSHQPGRPSLFELDRIQTAARLAAVAIEHNRAENEKLRESEDRFRGALAELEELREDLRQQFSFEDFVAVSPAMLKILQMASKVAPTDATVLITGETGTGKEVLARAIHANSHRARGPFIAINCGAIPETLMESELFGHERGAFTGADRRKLGRVERAIGGVLFLDEVGELTPSAQVKLLRLLQEKTFERVGGTETLPADVRIIAATNRDLAAEMKQGPIRDDLFYRLNVFRIDIPPLRERREAIPQLAKRILQRIARELGRSEISLSKTAADVLLQDDWKGNVRELENALERAAILCGGSLIGPEHLPILPGKQPRASRPENEDEVRALLEPGFRIDEFEDRLVRQAMKLSRGNQTRAAQLLGVSRGSLRYRLRKTGK